MRKEQKNLYQITNVCVCVSECVLQNDTLNFKENKIVMPKQKEENKLMNKIKKIVRKQMIEFLIENLNKNCI